MTLAEIIAQVDEFRPNMFTKEQKTAWINEIESKVVSQVINKALWGNDKFVPYEYELNAETTLRVPDESCDVYRTYLFAKMDYMNAETDRYNMDAAMHDAAWKDYASEYRREHYPYPYETSARTFIYT